MMVEAGASIVPEDVMAEAILFGHRALQPLIDIQEQLREAVGKPKVVGYLEPGTASVLDFVKHAKDDFVVVDVETTGRDPKVADLIEIAPCASATARSSIASPHSSARRGPSSAPRCTASPTPTWPTLRPPVKRSASSSNLPVRRARRPQRRLRPWLPRRSARRADEVRGRTSYDTLAIAREGYPDLESYKLGDIAASSASRSRPPTAASPTETTATILLRSAEDLAGRVATIEDGIAVAVRANRQEGQTRPRFLEAARRQARVSKNLFNLIYKKTVRRLVLDEGVRMTAAAWTNSARSRRSRRSAASPRIRLFTRGEHRR